MIDQDNIQHLKQAVRIVDFLFTQGFTPVYRTGDEHVYLSPIRNEKTPSFYVNDRLNRYKDFGEPDNRGDILRLAQQILKIDFREAVAYFNAWDGQSLPENFSYSGHNYRTSDTTERGLIVSSTSDIIHPALWAYLNGRGISRGIGSRYLRQVNYTLNGKHRFGLGFQNDQGGFAIRAKGIKHATKPAHFTTIERAGSTSVNLFEGYFDFLSALEYYGLEIPTRTTIILNSVNMLGRSLSTLAGFEKVHCFLDRDSAGIKALARLRSEEFEVIDQSQVYAPHNDFNDFLINPTPLKPNFSK